MGINVLAPVNQLGYGIVGRNLLKSLAKRTRVAWWPIGPPDSLLGDAAILQSLLANASLFEHNPPSLRIWHQFAMAEHVGKGLHAGLPIFELDRFNEQELHHLKSLDVVFALSQWAAMVLAGNGIPKEKIRRTHCGVDLEIFRHYEPDKFSKELKRTLPCGPHTTIFLNVGKWEVRKGHDILGDAFADAFLPSDDVLLVMACSNPFLTPAEADEWASLYKERPIGNKIILLKDRLPTQKHLAQLMDVADCGVFPSRAEGWNLDLAEMMAMGKPVIATKCSAHTEFVSEANCRLIEIDESEPAYDGKWFLGEGSWAKLGSWQYDQLILHMRDVHSAKRMGELLVNENGKEMFTKHFTWHKAATAILEGLDV